MTSSANIFVTLATEQHLEYHCKGHFETTALPLEVRLNRNYVRISGKTRCALLHYARLQKLVKLFLKRPVQCYILALCCAYHFLDNVTGSTVLGATRPSIKRSKGHSFKEFLHIISHYIFQPIWPSSSV
jgi:hypothetical protein